MLATLGVADPVPFVTVMAVDPAEFTMLCIVKADPVVAPTIEINNNVPAPVIELFVIVNV